MADNPPPLPPAGWYNDPEGQPFLRWFDSTKWTEFTRPAEAASLPAPVSADPIGSVSLEELDGASAPASPATTSAAVSQPSAPDPESTARTWADASARWGQIIDGLPEWPTAKTGMFSSQPKGFSPTESTGRTVGEIAVGWGRPTWWTPEPATGGAIAGWSSSPAVAMHFTVESVCDRVLSKTHNEIDVSWGLRRLGNVIGRPQSNVEAFLGLPSSRSGTAGGGSLLQWQRPGYHVALRFGADNLCQGITHQFAARPSRV